MHRLRDVQMDDDNIGEIKEEKDEDAAATLLSESDDGVHSVQRALDELVNRGQRFALSSDIWRYAVETERCDVLITTPPAHPRGKQIAVWLIERIKKNASGIKVEVRYHSLTNCYALYLTGAYISLLKGAELLNLRKLVRPTFGGGKRAFVFDDSRCYVGIENRETFLSGQERANIVRAMLDMVRAGPGGESLAFAIETDECQHPNIADRSADEITTTPMELLVKIKNHRIDRKHIREGQALLPALIARDLIGQVVTLHEPTELDHLRQNWVTSVTAAQPLDDIRRYFGAQIAMYFAWLGHLTTALWLPAFFGIFIYWVGGGKTVTTDDKANRDDTSLWSDVCFVAFALFNCVWSTIFLETWKRRQAELAFRWGTLTVEQHLDEPRPEFKGDYLVASPVTGRLEPYYPIWKHRLLRFGVALPATCLCLLAMFTAMFWIFRLQDVTDYYFADKFLLSWVTILPNIIYAIVIIVGDALYRQLALFLNDLENYRTDDEYENFLIVKIVGFQCVSAFGSLFYIAFYLRDMERLQETLATLLIVRQVIQNVCETVVPYFAEKLKLSRLTYQLTKSMSDDSLRKHVDVIRSKRESVQGESMAETVEKTTSASDDTELRRRKGESKVSGGVNSDVTDPSPSSVRLPVPEFKVGADGAPEVTQAELESLLPVYLRPLDDYLEMFVQFGYVLLFSPAFPLAAVCALVNDLLEIRVDAFKLCTNVQRPFGKRVKNIGAWQRAMEMLGMVGVMVNCALIGQSGLVQRVWPDMGWGEQVLLIVLLEHLVLAIKYSLDLVIPDTPHWVRLEMAKMEHRRREAFKRESRLLSLSASDDPVPVFEDKLLSPYGHRGDRATRSLTPEPPTCGRRGTVAASP